jgi:hypothetical protein
LAADAWTSAFFWELRDSSPTPPVSIDIGAILRGNSHVLSTSTLANSRKLSDDFQFFHWYLEFPDVFQNGNNGFDCILGNPPWEQVRFDHKEFFKEYRPDIANSSGSKREQLIQKLKYDDPFLWAQYLKEVRDSYLKGKFLSESGRFPRSSRGDINLFALFAEHSLHSLGNKGLVGMILPTSIAMLYTFKDFFVSLVDEKKLVSLYDFDNRKKLFPVHSAIKFCLMTFGHLYDLEDAIFSFSMLDPEEMKDENKRIVMGKQQFALLNPNMLTCPIFKNKLEADIVTRIYKKFPAAIIESKTYNPWGLYYMRLIDLGDYNKDHPTAKDLEEMGFTREGMIFTNSTETYLPLYESKLIFHYDWRYATFEGCSNHPRETYDSEHTDSNFEPTPQYWFPERIWHTIISKYSHDRDWLLVYRDTTGATNQRTCISTIIPRLPATRSMPALGIANWKMAPFLMANLNSMILDFVARTKIGSQHMNYGVIKQLPLLPQQSYQLISPKVKDRILECVLNLICDNDGVGPFARDFGFKFPVKWNENTRFNFSRELDAIYAHLYGVDKNELLYILDSFDALRNAEEKKYGIYKTSQEVIKWYDHYSETPIWSNK